MGLARGPSSPVAQEKPGEARMARQTKVAAASITHFCSRRGPPRGLLAAVNEEVLSRRVRLPTPRQKQCRPESS
jgi:hypothetical protein